jgi:N-acetylglucosaminyldiphosphoundecaprenol N-acetyl-beta-D-mannosaminyltransferase
MSVFFPARKRANAVNGLRPRTAFGLAFDNTDVIRTARVITTRLLHRSNDAHVYVTPNIQHVSEMRRNPELRSALQEADLVTCDGFPLVMYAQWRGCDIPGRVTGREVVEEIMLRTALDPAHVLFFLIESAETAAAVAQWAERRGLSHQVIIEVAPPRFGESERDAAALADRIRGAGTTLLFLGLGAPKCELFATRFRSRLGPCWAMCIGQSVRVSLGLIQGPPQKWVDLRLEWAWRIVQEPRRLIGRYVSSALGFAAAVAQDLLGRTDGDGRTSVRVGRAQHWARMTEQTVVEPAMAQPDAAVRAIPLAKYGAAASSEDYLIDHEGIEPSHMQDASDLEQPASAAR